MNAKDFSRIKELSGIISEQKVETEKPVVTAEKPATTPAPARVAVSVKAEEKK